MRGRVPTHEEETICATGTLRLAQQYLDDAQYLLATDRLASAVSRAYYAAYHAAYQAMCVRGYWFAPTHPTTGPSLLESLRFGLRRLYELRLDVDYDAVPISRASAEAGVQIVHRALAEIDQRT